MRLEDIGRLVEDRSAEGEFVIHRDIFRDPALFELEMRNIFEGTWVFLGLSSQVPKAHDFYATWIGRQPVLVMRDGEGKLGAFFNTCRHRGALVCHLEQGNAKYHVCHYHGWAYDSAGKNVGIKDHKQGGYSQKFEAQDHNLVRVPRFGEYRGFLFGSANADVHPLEEHLGDTRKFLDLIVDQSPLGVELVPGSSTYTYDGNWKLQIENCVDGYHFTSTHRSFMSLVGRRNSGESAHKLKTMDMDALKGSDIGRGNYTFRFGHAVALAASPNPELRPIFGQVEEIRRRMGDERTKWMFGNRNLTIYPNMQLADNFSVQLRVIRPLAVDRTEMKIFCLAPVGEPAAQREYRLRQYEDFFNATGMATPDDTICYEDCQSGYAATYVEAQQGYARGMTVVARGPDQKAAELGITPETRISGPFDLADETVFQSGHREWLRLMDSGISRGGRRGAPIHADKSFAGSKG